MIYIHIQKAGGTSIEVSISAIAKWNDLVLGGTRQAELLSHHYGATFGIYKHSSAAKVKALIGDETWNSYYSWATVRNPYSRIASLYGYIAALTEPRLQKIGFPRDASHQVQADWVESAAYPAGLPWSFPGAKVYLATRSAPRPFSEFLRSPQLADNTSGFKSQARWIYEKNRTSKLVRKVVKLEELSTSWTGLMAEMGLGDVPLIPTNQTPNQWKKSPKELFDNRDDIALVNKRFHFDFRLFEYEKI